ncbi:hypothetical protein Tco_0794609 [Tanacetum coccineum]
MLLRDIKAAWKAEYKIHSDVACLMLGRMSPALQRQFELYFPQAMLDELKRINFNMHVGKTVSDLHALLIDYEKGLKDKSPTPQVLAIQMVVGSQEEERPLYLHRVCRTNKKRRPSMVLQLQDFRVKRKLSYGEQYLHVGNGSLKQAVEA